MTNYQKIITIAAFIFLLFTSTNPTTDEHREAIVDLIQKENDEGKELLKKITLLTGYKFNGLVPLFVIKRKNLFFFSKTILKYKDEEIQIGTGYLNNIFLNVNALDERLGVMSGFEISPSGLQYKIFSTGSGEYVQPGNFIKFQFEIKYKDSIIMSSYNTMPFYDQVETTQRYHDYTEFLSQMKVGDSAVYYQQYDSLQKKSTNGVPTYMKNGETQQVTIKLLASFRSSSGNNPKSLAQSDFENELSNIKKRELSVIKNYLQKNNINAVLVNNSVYVEKLSDGYGEQAVSGMIVGINYSGYTLDGKPFDSNIDHSKQLSKHPLEPFFFVSQQSGAIQGMLDGVGTLKEGDRARLYIPSMAAYGSQGNPPAIKPYENLIFEIEVLSVRNR